MKYNGLNFRRNRHIGWRNARKGDTYTNGEQVDGFGVVVFRVSDVPRHNNSGVCIRSQVSSDMLIPSYAHTDTCVVLGKAKVGIGKSCKGLRYTTGSRSGQEISSGDIYAEQIHYLVKDNTVYQFTARRTATQRDL